MLEMWRRLLDGGKYVAMGDFTGRRSEGGIRNATEASHSNPKVSGDDDFMGGRHSNGVCSQTLEHAKFRWRFIRWPTDARVDAFAQHYPLFLSYLASDLA